MNSFCLLMIPHIVYHKLVYFGSFVVVDGFGSFVVVVGFGSFVVVDFGDYQAFAYKLRGRQYSKIYM